MSESMLSAGIDVGSAAAKVVLEEDNGEGGARLLAGDSERIRRRDPDRVAECALGAKTGGSRSCRGHLHAVFLDGAWYEEAGDLCWQGLGHLKTSEDSTVTRIVRHLRRRGLLRFAEGAADPDGDPESNLAASAVSGQTPPAGPLGEWSRAAPRWPGAHHPEEGVQRRHDRRRHGSAVAAVPARHQRAPAAFSHRPLGRSARGGKSMETLDRTSAAARTNTARGQDGRGDRQVRQGRVRRRVSPMGGPLLSVLPGSHDAPRSDQGVREHGPPPRCRG